LFFLLFLFWRIFGSLSDAVDNAKPGEWIYLQGGNYRDCGEFRIKKPVHIFGDVGTGKTGNNLLRVNIWKPVVWDCGMITQASIANLCVHVDEKDKCGVEVKRGDVMIRRVIFQEALGVFTLEMREHHCGDVM